MKSEKYPIGPFSRPEIISDTDLNVALDQLLVLPDRLSNLVANWSDDQLDTPYREGGWTARQVIHHLADSHLHSFIRYKWALSENTPLIKAYDQDGWAMLADARMPIESSLALLKSVHQKIVFLCRELSKEQWSYAFIHPETKKERDLKENTLLYAWHGEHHFAHLAQLALKMGW